MSISTPSYVFSSKLDATSTSFETKSNDTTYKLKRNFKRILIRDVFTIPVASVASESAFSIGSRVVDGNCSSLLLENNTSIDLHTRLIHSQKAK
ncbi:hypothetical protein Taro_050692, partial [Colocasia esculenta]|nr:hypothetical protein [Colocasia esculenta]